MAISYLDVRRYIEAVAKQEFPPLIISVALTGGVHGKETNPNLPETPEEQAQQGFEAYKAGASIIHVHARDPATGYATPSVNPDHYREVNHRIRELCPEAIINNTTGGGLGKLTTEQRARSLDADPEIASLNTGVLAWKTKLRKRSPPLTGRDEDVYMDSIWPPTFSWGESEIFAQAMLDRKIKPELEIYHPGQFAVAYSLIDKTLIASPFLFQFVMGAPSGVLPTPRNLLSMLDHVPPGSIVSVIGTGLHQLSLTTIAMAMGLHVRVGLEDNIYYSRGVLCRNNAQLVERTVRIAKELNRQIATPKETREILGLDPTPKKYT
jgi:3-keto-5-aminohexanoate cleavage enzyme